MKSTRLDGLVMECKIGNLGWLVKENSGLLFKRMGHIYFSSVFILTFSSLYTQKWRICYDEIETLEARS
jgi:hypothetical protein